jgi:hypothetical protein
VVDFEWNHSQLLTKKKWRIFATLVLISKVLYGFEVKIFNSLKCTAKSTYASSLFSIASSKQGFVFKIFWYQEFGKAFQKNLAELVEFTLEPKKKIPKISQLFLSKKTTKLWKKDNKIVFTIARNYSTISRRAIHHTQKIHLDIHKYTTH